jgi:hypothetical protein
MENVSGGEKIFLSNNIMGERSEFIALTIGDYIMY